MKRLTQHLPLWILVLALLPAGLQAQYKREVPSIPGLSLGTSNSSTRFLGVDLSRVDMSTSYSMSVSSFGNDAVAMGLLKTNFNYYINPQVQVQGYVGLIHSPFSSFTPTSQEAAFMNGISMDNVMYGGEITYRPKENISFQFSFNQMPRRAAYMNYPYSYLRAYGD